MKKLFLLPCTLISTLLLTGCSNLDSYSNNYYPVKSDIYSSPEKTVSKSTTQNVTPLEAQTPSTPESGYESLIKTWEGCVLFFGWEEGFEVDYDESALTTEERELAIQKGLNILSDKAEEKGYTSWVPAALANYYLIKEDYKKAMYWAFRGAENGSPDCMFLLSNAYRSGEGLVQDLVEGIKWTYLGAAAGDASCKNWVVENGFSGLRNEFYAPIIREAQKRASLWMNEHPEVFISSE